MMYLAALATKVPIGVGQRFQKLTSWQLVLKPMAMQTGWPSL